MFGDVPIPALDLSRAGQLSGRLPWRVLDLIVEGLDPAKAKGYERSGELFMTDDDSVKDSQFTCKTTKPSGPFRVRKAREAWPLAAERGLIPRSWLDEPRRVFPDQEVTFFCDRCNGMGATGYNYDDLCDACDGRGNAMIRHRVAVPGSIEHAAWMFAHPGVVEEAEGLAREAVRRLPGGREVEQVQWGRVREGKAAGTVPLVIVSPIWDDACPAPWDYEAMLGPAFRGAPWWSQALRMKPDTRSMMCFDVGGAWAHRAAGVERSPFEPLLRLWELGVVFEELSSDLIVLDRATSRTYIPTWRAHVPCA